MRASLPEAREIIMNPRDQFLAAGFLAPEASVKRAPTRFRTIWISDIHLGTTGCQAARLLEFLRATESDTLYLVGDIIDGWQLQRRWYWDQIHNNVVQAVLKKARKGTEVIFVPGNHDEAIRQFIDLDFGGIRIRDELVHTTAQGKRMLVLHGDRFDGVIACAKWLAYVGDGLYTMILKFNQIYNVWRARRSAVLVAVAVPETESEECGELHLFVRGRAGGGSQEEGPRWRHLRPYPQTGDSSHRRHHLLQ